MYHSGMLTIAGSWIFSVLPAVQKKYTCRALGVLCCLNSTCHDSTAHHKNINEQTHRALIALKYLMFTAALGRCIDLRFEYVTVH